MLYIQNLKCDLNFNNDNTKKKYKHIIFNSIEFH